MNLLTATSTLATGQGLHAASVPGQLRVAVAKTLLTLALCCLSMRRAAQSCEFGSSPHNNCACCRIGPWLPAIAHLSCGRLPSLFFLALFYFLALIFKVNFLNTRIFTSSS